jgi:hypothetical protein
MENTHYEQFLVAYARGEWGKVIDLYKYHDEFPPCDDNIWGSIYTVAQIEFYSL